MAIELTATQKFQFHTGSIRSPQTDRGKDSKMKFQFHTGSIRSRLASLNPTRAIVVSIPHWFD